MDIALLIVSPGFLFSPCSALYYYVSQVATRGPLSKHQVIISTLLPVIVEKNVFVDS